MRYFSNCQVPGKDAGGNQRAATLGVGLDKTRVCASGGYAGIACPDLVSCIQPILYLYPRAVLYRTGTLVWNCPVSWPAFSGVNEEGVQHSFKAETHDRRKPQRTIRQH